MKYLACFALLPFLFCTAHSETRTFDASALEPQPLYASLRPREKETLQKYGFIARKSAYPKFSTLYQHLKTGAIPVYVTTDCVLHTYHILYDYSLRILEMNYLYGDAVSLVDSLIAQTKMLLEDTDGQIREALFDNLAYFEIGAKLLDSDYAISTEVQEKVTAELALIEKAEAIEKSPLFGYREDYSQYKPRGHYTRNETLQRYFRAMMWFGRMAFYLKPEKDPMNAQGKWYTKRALLVMEIAQEHLAHWQRLSAPIELYVGKSDDLTVQDYLEMKREHFADKRFIDIASDDMLLEQFITQALLYRPPQIVSTVVPDTMDPQIATKGMRFLGQKYIPDAYIFQNLVYDIVGTQTNPRIFPRGLDVLAVLGSARARDILLETYNEDRDLNYTKQLNTLSAEFSAIEEDDWFTNLYWGWLATLKSLLPAVPGFQPAYQDKCLQTALGSWAELRHDTILYAKQSYTMEITAVRPRPEVVKGYVEPIPECYARLKQLVDMSKQELEKSAFLDNLVAEKFTTFSQLLSQLHDIAIKERNGETLTDDEYIFIHNIGGALEGLETFPAGGYQTETDESAALIADVHTDPNTKMVLEVANAVPALLYTVVTIEGKPHLFAGGVYDYYEFLQPLAERLTDEQWQELSPKPEKPGWIEFFAE